MTHCHDSFFLIFDLRRYDACVHEKEAREASLTQGVGVFFAAARHRRFPRLIKPLDFQNAVAADKAVMVGTSVYLSGLSASGNQYSACSLIALLLCGFVPDRLTDRLVQGKLEYLDTLRSGVGTQAVAHARIPFFQQMIGHHVDISLDGILGQGADLFQARCHPALGLVRIP
ncbi:hypothetical protein [Acidithiobacillus ferrivorans]|uniref:hypothetical protein n=1 Tax=Acidithiobacillus ferrivorans TaxID=160808 RepID=UPI0013053F0E|nr:hypothetical protein [Acidithiobacillus ferrivorans]